MQEQKKVFRIKHYDFFITIFVVFILVMNIKLTYGIASGIFDRFNAGTSCTVHVILVVIFHAAVSISGPTSVLRGSTNNFAVALTNATLGGFNISTNGGTFTAGGNNTANSNQTQLTHTSRNCNILVFSMDCTSSLGPVTFSVCALPVDGIASQRWMAL